MSIREIMLRVLVCLVLLDCIVTAPALADDASGHEHRFGLTLGPAVWMELAGQRCEIDSDTSSCQSGVVDGLVGGRARFDVDVLRWLRVGAQLGVGYSLDQTSVVMSGGGGETHRSWFVPMGAHAYALLPHRRTTWWLGPELLYSLRIDQVTHTNARGAPEQAERDARSGLLLGGALGFDTRLGDSRVSLGLELGVALSVAQTQQLPKPVEDGTLSAMTRLGLMLRVAL